MADQVGFKKQVTDFFGPCFRAVSEKSNFDFLAIFQVKEEHEDGTVQGLMFPEPGKNFDLTITDVEKREDEWIITTSQQRWSWRRVDHKVYRRFLQDMTEAGIHA